MRLKNFDGFDQDGTEQRGTLGKNRQIYTNLYDYHSKHKDRQGMVGWLAPDSQIRNYAHILPELREGESILDFGCGVGDLVPFIRSNIDDFDYTGVDINEKFIGEASRTYPAYDFRHIDSPSEIRGRFDLVVAIGVFTWYITKKDFQATVRRLYQIAGRSVVITCIHSIGAPHSWRDTYRGYDQEVFVDALPDLADRMEFERKGPDLVVTIRKGGDVT
jgi:cyclopropane fatty-acyl-phospholipid synthase-like methyltransferase